MVITKTITAAFHCTAYFNIFVTIFCTNYQTNIVNTFITKPPHPHNSYSTFYIFQDCTTHYTLYSIVFVNIMSCCQNCYYHIIYVNFKLRFINTHIFAPVKPYIHHYTIFHTFQDLFEHTFVYNYVICKFFICVYYQHCVTKPPKHCHSIHLLNSGLALCLNHCQCSKFNQIASKLFHCKKGDVAVHEYANSTSAHYTFGAQIQPYANVLQEHRFSPTQTSFTP